MEKQEINLLQKWWREIKVVKTAITHKINNKSIDYNKRPFLYMLACASPELDKSDNITRIIIFSGIAIGGVLCTLRQTSDRYGSFGKQYIISVICVYCHCVKMSPLPFKHTRERWTDMWKLCAAPILSPVGEGTTII